MEFASIKKLFETLKTIGFWGRIFRWGEVKNLAFEAFGELSKLFSHLEATAATISTLKSDGLRLSDEKTAALSRISVLESDYESAKKELRDLDSKLALLQSEKEGINRQMTEAKSSAETKEREFVRMQGELTAKEKRITELEKEREERAETYSKNVEMLNKAHENLQQEKDALRKAEAEKAERQLAEMKETWSRHEVDVEEKMRALCQKHQVEYVDKEKVPFKGKPDNTVKICDEHIIFDAKSPQSDDLGNFETYIKSQAEAAKKYAKQESVKGEIFLVVPTNAIPVVKDRSYNLADYKVYVITTDALEPILLSLQKIEEYEFAESLSPEDRQAICTVVGKMAHGIKRRIQVDQFFAKEFIGILHSAESMPKDFLDDAVKIERAAKINPPQEKRAKEIPLKDLEQDSKKLQAEIAAKGINTSSMSGKFAEIPLYKSEEDSE